MNQGLTLTLKTPGVKIYHIVLYALGFILLIFLVPRIDVTIWPQAAIFAVLSFLARLMPTNLPQGVVFSVSFLIDLVLLELYGTSVAVGVATVIAALAGLLPKSGEGIIKGDFLRDIAQKTIVVSLAGTAHLIFLSTFFSFALAFIIYFMAEIFLMALTSTVEGSDSLKENLVSLLQMLYLNYIVLSPLAYFMTVIYRNVQGEMKLLSILLFYLPIMLVSHSFRLYTNINRSYLNTIKTIVKAIEAKDPFTSGHSERVAEFAVALAKEMGYSRKDLKNLYFLALLHDCGKIGVSEEVLNKSVPLTPAEVEQIREHVVVGARIIEKIKFLQVYADVVMHHHEWFDGKGYPSGLKGDEIPVEAKILAVADAYDAMLNERPYRGAKTQQEALEEMTGLAGRQFDPAMVELLKKVLRKRGELHAV